MDCSPANNPNNLVCQQDGSVLGAITAMKSALLKEIQDTRADVAGLSSKVDEYMGRLKNVEDQCLALQQTVNANEHAQAQINKDINQTIQATKTSITQDLEKTKEKLDRMTKAANLIIKGIPEEDSSDLFAQLIEIILPKREDIPKFIRIGDKSDERPRVIKTFLSSANEKATALRNCRLLKGIVNFSKVSVQPDLTQKQREERIKTIMTRSRGRRRTTESEDRDDGPSSKKQKT